MTKSTELKLLPNQEFHMYVGYCITAWAKVEEHLFDAFQEILSISRQHAAILYYRISGLDQRISTTDELVGAALPKPTGKGEHSHPDLIRWKEINKNLRGLLSVRR